MKRRVILCSGNGRRFPIGPYIHRDDEFNFATYAHIFDPLLWEGEHIPREEVFQNPAVLNDADLWFIHTEQSDAEVPRVLAARDYAQAQGVKVIAQPNGEHGANILCGSWPVYEFWRRFDAIALSTNEPGAAEAFEALTGKPCLGMLLPYVEEYFDHMVHLASTITDMGMPDDIGERFLIPHGVSARSFITLLVAQTFGIKLVLPDYHYGRDILDGINRFRNPIDADNFNNPADTILFADPTPDHSRWLTLLAHCAGIFSLSSSPAHGRGSAFATVFNVPSLCCRHGWQVELYPELILSPEYSAGANWASKVELARSLIPLGMVRLRKHNPEYCQNKLETWFAEHGWF